MKLVLNAMTVVYFCNSVVTYRAGEKNLLENLFTDMFVVKLGPYVHDWSHSIHLEVFRWVKETSYPNIRHYIAPIYIALFDFRTS